MMRTLLSAPAAALPPPAARPAPGRRRRRPHAHAVAGRGHRHQGRHLLPHRHRRSPPVSRSRSAPRPATTCTGRSRPHAGQVARGHRHRDLPPTASRHRRLHLDRRRLRRPAPPPGLHGRARRPRPSPRRATSVTLGCTLRAGALLGRAVVRRPAARHLLRPAVGDRPAGAGPRPADRGGPAGRARTARAARRPTTASWRHRWCRTVKAGTVLTRTLRRPPPRRTRRSDGSPHRLAPGSRAPAGSGPRSAASSPPWPASSASR